MFLLRAATFLSALLIALAVGGSLPCTAAETIGSIRNQEGTAVIVRDGQRVPAARGVKLQEGDILETGPDGRLGLILRDDSLLSLGPSSRIALERFVFVPAEAKLGLTARILRGTFAYLSGIFGRLAPDATTFVTPVATIGVRGTHFAVRVEE